MSGNNAMPWRIMPLESLDSSTALSTPASDVSFYYVCENFDSNLITRNCIKLSHEFQDLTHMVSPPKTSTPKVEGLGRELRPKSPKPQDIVGIPFHTSQTKFGEGPTIDTPKI